ncbi:MAG: NIPSNAP family protein [Verrucomicrobiales bacterium]|nr:NIPSNAP family protein [Verrucomicrobiales bacterium]
MKTLLFLVAFATLLPFSLIAEEKLTCFELRTYHSNDGKLEDLHARFRDHTVALFEKHGMTNLIYWEPVENEENLLVYLLGYPDRASRDLSWKAFRDDPEWKAAYRKSTESGKLVGKVDSVFLELTDYSPVSSFPAPETASVYELRQYTTNEGKLDDLDARFRDHTIGLFSKHGITNLCYFHPSGDQENAGNTLLYFISAPSIEARNDSFKKFGSDPEWKAARDASEKDGKLLVKKGVMSMFLKTTGYSPVK